MKFEKLIKPDELIELVSEVAYAKGNDLRTFLYQDLIVNSLNCKRLIYSIIYQSLLRFLKTEMEKTNPVNS